MDYTRYIQSSRWESRRRRYFEAHPEVCAACGTNKRVQLHHLTYERIGSERDSDLMALCERHHSAAHNRHRKVGGLLEVATQDLVAMVHRGKDSSKKPKPRKKQKSRAGTASLLPEGWVPLNRRTPGEKGIARLPWES